MKGKSSFPFSLFRQSRQNLMLQFLAALKRARGIEAPRAGFFADLPVRALVS